MAKNTDLVIKAIPASGYKLETLTLNDEEVDSPNFKVTSSVTIGGIFTVSSQIDAPTTDALKVSGGKNYLSFYDRNAYILASLYLKWQIDVLYYCKRA